MATVFDQVKRIIVEQLGVDENQVVPNASLADDLNADSLDFVEVGMALEEEFSKDGRTIEVEDQDVEGIVTVQDIVDLLRNKGIEDDED